MTCVFNVLIIHSTLYIRLRHSMATGLCSSRQRTGILCWESKNAQRGNPRVQLHGQEGQPKTLGDVLVSFFSPAGFHGDHNRNQTGRSCLRVYLGLWQEEDISWRWRTLIPPDTFTPDCVNLSVGSKWDPCLGSWLNCWLLFTSCSVTSSRRAKAAN